VSAQRFDAGGVALGGEQLVNTYTSNQQQAADVAARINGAFVVVWDSGCRYGSSSADCAPDGSPESIAAQRFDAGGVPVGAEEIVNSFTTGFDTMASVAAAPNGNFVVVWTNNNYAYPEPDRDTVGLFAQRFEDGGGRSGGETPINIYLPGTQDEADVAVDAAGNFVVVWHEYLFATSYVNRIMARRYDAGGNALGGEVVVSGATVDADRPSVAAAADGSFVVVWDEQPQYGTAPSDIRVRRFGADGALLGDAQLVNTYTTGFQRPASVASDGAGNFVVVWRTYGYFGDSPDGDDSGVFGQAFARDGSPLGSEFQVNAYTTGHQGSPTIAANPAGDFVVAWASGPGYAYPGPTPQDGDDQGVFARRLALHPCTEASECDDANPCTTDACEGDVCLNRRQPGCCTNAVECSDGNACTDDACVDNACPHTAIPDCIPCTFQKIDCLPLDACTLGSCECTSEECVEATCVFERSEPCCVTPADCDDGHACTADTCTTLHQCIATPILGCVECAADAECATGCEIGPETCDAGQCVSPEGCPTIEIDGTEPLGTAGALLLRIVVPESAPGKGKTKGIVTARIGAPGDGETPAKRCATGKRIGQLRVTLAAAETNLLLELNKRGTRCLAADPDGRLGFDVEVSVKRKKTPLATVTESRTWRQ